VTARIYVARRDAGPMPGAPQAEEALEQADAAFARFDFEAVVTHLSAAIRGFTAAEEPCRAAMACVQLGKVLGSFLGNLTASRAWFQRAERLVADAPPCLEQGWVAVAAMGCDVHDPDVLLAKAQLALDRARQFGDLNLETKALADGGLAHVEAGRVAEGMAMLDEAMALACGPADDQAASAQSVCSFFTACYFAMDFERAGSWTDLLRKHGLIGSTPGGPMFLSSHCDSVQATLLMELGRWTEAEELLLKAKADFEAVMGPAWHPDIALADLRTRQGRFADAEALLLGKEQAMQAFLPAARLQMERGDADLALATARRGLRLLGDDRLRAVELLTVVTEALVMLGDLEQAVAACNDLDARLVDVDVRALTARRDAVRAKVLMAQGEATAAAGLLEAAVDRLDPAQLPWLRARLLLHASVAYGMAGDAAAAERADREAAAAFDALDVVVPDRPPRPAGATSAPSGDRAQLGVDGRWCTAAHGDTRVRLPRSKGLRYLQELVRSPGVERHALDLVDLVEGQGPGDVDRRSLGDAGELLDSTARAQYRRRIESLRANIEEALEAGRLDEAEALQGELDLLVAQLAQAFGLGGRSRVAASAAEKARLNVTRALRSALSKLEEELPGAGAALDRRIRTGVYCAYEPQPDDEIRWIVQS
jgi:tetratricopeptide (TPR) repeat protein